MVTFFGSHLKIEIGFCHIRLYLVKGFVGSTNVIFLAMVGVYITQLWGLRKRGVMKHLSRHFISLYSYIFFTFGRDQKVGTGVDRLDITKRGIVSLRIMPWNGTRCVAQSRGASRKVVWEMNPIDNNSAQVSSKRCYLHRGLLLRLRIVRGIEGKG